MRQTQSSGKNFWSRFAGSVLFSTVKAHNMACNRGKLLRDIYQNLWANIENISQICNPRRQLLRRPHLHQCAPRHPGFLAQLLHASPPCHPEALKGPSTTYRFLIFTCIRIHYLIILIPVVTVSFFQHLLLWYLIDSQ